MQVDDKVRKPIVFIGKASETFVAHGTGFIAASFIDDHGFQQVITAKHVLDRILGDEVDLRLNTHAGEARTIKTKKEWWHPHPDKRVDVSVFPCAISKEEYHFLHMPLEGPEIMTDAVIASREIGVGDDVVIAGMYVARLGETKNIPIVRTGTIAAMPEEKLRTEFGYHHAYLIEARSIDGLSGSPVFVHLPPWRKERGQMRLLSGHYQYFMGILLGHAQVANPGDTIEIIQSGADRENDDDAVRATVPLNTGIGVVLPISYVVEAVEQPFIHNARKASLAKGDPDRKFVADSAAARERLDLPATDEVPNHRDRFTALLNAAAKTPPQAD